VENDILIVNEIFYSIQGESLLAGKPSVFIRLSSCNLRCNWCDTTYSYDFGKKMRFSEVFDEIRKFDTNYVCVTGGEPLFQDNTIFLLKLLVEANYTVSLETNGSYSVKDVPKEVIKVIDIKCPSSGESEKNLWDNVNYTSLKDQFKFVIGSKEDFIWAQSIIEKFNLNEKCSILFSPVYGVVSPKELAAWILDSHAKVTMQLQLHKEIWKDELHR